MNPLLKFTIFSLILIVSRSLLIPQQPVAAMDDSAHPCCLGSVPSNQLRFEVAGH
jgi:hypothetical protein